MPAMAKSKSRSKARPKPAWLSMLPRGVDPSKLTLAELRNFKQAHALLTEKIPGPEGIAYYIRAFRYLLLFGIACVVEDTYPPLTRCWKELEQLFMNDPAFDDGIFVQSWILMDFPFGPEDQTALDYFEAFLEGTDAGTEFQLFIDEARRSRLGLHEDVMRTKSVARYRELFTGRVISAFPSVDAGETGEILLTRTLAYRDQVFLFGDPKCFPGDLKAYVEDMVGAKLFYFEDAGTTTEQYESFMKLAGPYWMSCVNKNEDLPILDPDHYLTYLADR
jgi:hypothetical protein